MELPKDKVEVYASLRSTHPTEYDNDFTAHLRNGRDNVSVSVICLEQGSRDYSRIYSERAYLHLRDL